MTRPRLAPLSQGIYYLASGLWPVFHLASFEKVTGPKVDKWLVRTFGGLVAAVGASLVAGAFEEKRSRALAILGVGSALALGAADVIYAHRHRISRIYYGDAAAEAAVMATWAATRN